jgi:serine/threonine protein kinase|uniref:Protein kinase domain-containing protein n=1 Tax=Panagrolaimus sp. PS1159 TaxID=55785 RepID=A0AC35EWL9_9BILA
MITNVDDFKKDEEISSGGFSCVFKGSLRGVPVAIKVAKDEGRRSIHRELKIYDKISHPNILEPKGVHFGVDNMLFLPLRNFNLKDYFLDYKNVIQFQQLKQYSIQIADAMKYLHSKSILHCDLKIDNILVKDNNAEFVEISDFGCAIDLERDYEIKFLCTESHISYEILKSRKLPNVTTPVSKASDVWAFAVTMWQIFEKTHLLPIDFCKGGDIIKNYEIGKKLPIPATVSEDFWRYILLPCFDLHPKARPSMEDLHKSLINFREEASSCSKK